MIDFTPAFRLYARRRRSILARQNAAEAQKQQLQRLVARAQDTRFGSDHGFRSIHTMDDFQRAVPLRRYEDLWTGYWKDNFPVLVDTTWPGKIPYFAVTSGTTSGTSKRIPVSREMNRANTRAALDLLVHHLTHRPHSRPLGGKNFMLGGSTALSEQAPGVFSGDLSGIAVQCLPWWLRSFVFPPKNIACETDWETKIDRIAALAPHADIRIVGGTPSWLLSLFDRQKSLADDQASGQIGAAITARNLYPTLELLVHGGVNFAPYRPRFEAFLDGGAELREVYPASEGFIGLQDERPEDGLRLMVDNGLFFEFVPVDELEKSAPTRHTVANAEIGVNYAVVLSNCAGCWAYVLGDTVRFVSRDPPRILVTGRTSYFMSAFGEHLIGEEIEDAVSKAAAAIDTALNDFSMGAHFPSGPGEVGRHLYVVEFAGQDLTEQMTTQFVAVLDKVLCMRNDDYRQDRIALAVIGLPKLLTVPPGTFAAWMKSRGRLGGQNKVPRVINNTELFAQLLAFAREYTTRH